MNRIVREAVSEDSSFLSRVILQAGRSHTGKSMWDISIDDFDEKILQFIEKLTNIGDGHFCHYSNFHILEVDGVPACGAASYINNQKLMEESGAALVETARKLAWNEIKLKQLFEGMALWSKGVPPIDNDSYVIEWVATMPEFIRNGFAQLLIDEKIEQAKMQGFNSVFLHMQAGNAPAQSAYERKGFSIVDNKESSEFSKAVGNSGLILMVAKV